MSQQLVDGEPVELESDEERAGHSGTRRCTDIICLLIFGLAMVPFSAILGYAQENGDIRKVTHGYDFLGRLCGVDWEIDPSDGENKTLGPMLYWCPKVATRIPGQDQLNEVLAATSLDTMHPICVSACPTKEDVENGVTTRCFKDATHSKSEVQPDGTFTDEVTYNFAKVNVYEAAPFAGRYCYPKSEALQKSITEAFQSNPAGRYLISLTSVWNARWALACSAVIAFILGYIFLFIIDWCAKPIVYTCLVVLCAGPIISGAYVVYASQDAGIDGLVSTGDSTYDLIIGCILLAFGFGFTVFTFCSCHAIEVAIGCVQASCECLFAMPTLLLQPALALAVHMVVFVVMAYGFVLLMSCGEVTQTDLEAYVAISDSYNVQGIMRTFKFTTDQIEMMFYYIFVFFWFCELVTASSQFVLSYAVQLWYFVPYYEGESKDTPSFALGRGYCIAFTYHLGTLMFGSLIIAIFRLVRAILAYMARQAGEDANPVVKGTLACCQCCLACFQQCIEFLNKNAYMDVAINSTDFCHAAKNALQIIAGMMPELAILNGATNIVFIAGLGAITTAGCFVTWELVTRAEWFADALQHPDTYVSDPMTCTIAAGFISFIIALAFMTVFDSVSDTIIYCFETEKIRRQKNDDTIEPEASYAPYSLKVLLSDNM